MTNKYMKITCKTKDYLPLNSLTEFQGELKNRTSKDINKIVTSINKFGFATPFFVWHHDEINHVLDGHGRLAALHQMQRNGEAIPPLPVVYIDCENEEKAKQLLLRITSQYGEMTQDSVLDFMNGIDLEVEEIALPCGTLDLHIENEEETENDDEVPDVQEEAVSQLGEIYQLGDSLLMCGDSTKEEDVARLMGSEKADMVFTDPPYGVNMSRSLVSGKDNSIMNDDLNETELSDLLEKAVKNIVAYSKNNIPVYIWIGFRAYSTMEKIVKKYYKISNCIVWEKQSIGLGGKGYRFQHELCIFSGVINDKSLSDVWKFNRDKQGLHPTMKPVDLVCYALKNSSEKDGIILDLFGGSGSTLIACEKLNRKARLMELDPHYCDVIRRRYTKWAKENNKEITSGCLD